MSKERAVVQFYYEQGFSTSDIVRLLKKEKISKQFIHYTVRRLRDTGGIKDRKRTGRPRSVRTPALVKKIQRIVKNEPQRSQRKLSRKLNVSSTSVFRTIHDNLGYKAFKKRKQFALTAAQKKKRFDRSKLLLKRFKDGNLNSIVFSDEKLFVIEEKWNPQNRRVYAARFEDIPEEKRFVLHTQKPCSAMVWAAVSARGKFPLKFVETNVKMNGEYYRRHILERVLKPSGRRLFKNQRWIFQQDSAPAHRAKVNQEWCRREIPGFISADEWPPSSPDLNPLNYSIWGILEAEVNATQHRSLEGLRRAIRRAWLNLSQNKICASIKVWRERLAAVIKHRGGHFE